MTIGKVALERVCARTLSSRLVCILSLETNLIKYQKYVYKDCRNIPSLALIVCELPTCLSYFSYSSHWISCNIYFWEHQELASIWHLNMQNSSFIYLHMGPCKHPHRPYAHSVEQIFAHWCEDFSGFWTLSFCNLF